MRLVPILLRPHHFLCLIGYKGHNYSDSQVRMWDKIASMLKKQPDTDVFITKGKDSLCKNCPASKKDGVTSGVGACYEKNILELDKKVKTLLGLRNDKGYKYSDVTKIMDKKITRKIHEKLCSACIWWQKGLCKDSFKN